MVSYLDKMLILCKREWHARITHIFGNQTINQEHLKTTSNVKLMPRDKF